MKSSLIWNRRLRVPQHRFSNTNRARALRKTWALTRALSKTRASRKTRAFFPGPAQYLSLEYVEDTSHVRSIMGLGTSFQNNGDQHDVVSERPDSGLQEASFATASCQDQQNAGYQYNAGPCHGYRNWWNRLTLKLLNQSRHQRHLVLVPLKAGYRHSNRRFCYNGWSIERTADIGQRYSHS